MENNAEENELMNQYDSMIMDLKRQYLGQQQLTESINRDEKVWIRTEADRKLKAKRDEFHQQLLVAKGDIHKVREAVNQKRKESESKVKMVDYLEQENKDTQSHHEQINKIADDHLMDLEQKIVDCEYQKRQKRKEISEIN